MKLEHTPEYEVSYGLRKIWCPECRKRTPHEHENGQPANKWQAATPGAWYCMDCGSQNEADKR